MPDSALHRSRPLCHGNFRDLSHLRVLQLEIVLTTVDKNLKLRNDDGVKKRSRATEDSTLDAYMREVSRFPSLTLEEERELAARIRRHRDQQAFRRLVEANLRFVVGFAGQYRGLGVLLLDLIDEGNLGLMEAARRFDPERNGKFITYAMWWIRQSILHALADQGRAFAAPAEPRVAGRPGDVRVQGRRPIVDAALWQEMAEVFDEDDAVKGRSGAWQDDQAPAHPAVLAEEEEGVGFGTSGDLDQAAIDDRDVRDLIISAVREVLHELAPREREVIRLRFGLDAAPLTLQEVGDRLRVSGDRVRQIEARAIVKLRRSHKARELQSTLN